MQDNQHPNLKLRLYIETMGKLFRVGAICQSITDANHICETNKALSVIAEDTQNRIYLAEIEPTCTTPTIIVHHKKYRAQKLQLSFGSLNHFTLYIKSMLKIFQVTQICNTTEAFDAYRKTHPNETLVGTDSTGLHYLANQYSAIAPSHLIPE